MAAFNNIDDWKTDFPEDGPETTCSFCGEPSEKTFCSRECRIAEYND